MKKAPNSKIDSFIHVFTVFHEFNTPKDGHKILMNPAAPFDVAAKADWYRQMGYTVSINNQ